MNNVFTTICLVLFVASSPAATAGDSVARIVLPNDISVNELSIQLDSVAEITCADPVLRSKLGRIDIADFSSSKRAAEISRSYLHIRLRLAGIGREHFRLGGAMKCRIVYHKPALLTDAEVEAAAAIAFQEAIGGSAKDIRVRLSGPFMTALPTSMRERPGLRAVAMPPTRGRLGAVSTLVQLWQGKSLVLSRLTKFEVMQRQNVAITLASLSRDQPIDVNNLRLESRFVSKAQDQPTEKDLRNKTARRDIPPGQMLSLNDLKSAPVKKAGISVKARDTVQVEAISGRLRVRLRSAVAMQSGAVGDVIQFRNPESGSVRSGRISGHGTVQIQL